MSVDFTKCSIPLSRWTTCWAQCMGDGVTRQIWVGTETESWMIGHARNKDEAMKVLSDILNMIEAARILKGTT